MLDVQFCSDTPRFNMTMKFNTKNDRHRLVGSFTSSANLGNEIEFCFICPFVLTSKTCFNFQLGLFEQ